jgi:3-oxoacyl-[acyl-carrier protein] reductase
MTPSSCNVAGMDGSRHVVLVGAGDIAVASALALREKGFGTVHVLSRGRSGSADRACERLAAAGYDARAARCDVADWASVATAAESVTGPVGALIYSPAGERDFTRLEDLTQSAWQRSLDVFAGGLVGSVQALLPRLGRGTSVVALSGTSAHSVVSDRHLAMGSAKAALERAVGYLAATLAGRGVRVNAVASGPIETSSITSMLDAEGLDRLRAWQSAVTVPGRLGRPDDVGRIVSALCGTDLEWISGQVLVADGGAVPAALAGAGGEPLTGILDDTPPSGGAT